MTHSAKAQSRSLTGSVVLARWLHYFVQTTCCQCLPGKRNPVYANVVTDAESHRKVLQKLLKTVPCHCVVSLSSDTRCVSGYLLGFFFGFLVFGFV